MLLSHLLLELVAERPVASITESQYDRAVRCFSKFLNRPATVEDLVPLLVNQWLAEVAKRSKPRTVLGRKRGLTPIWNYATDRGLAPAYDSRRLRRVSVPHSIVSAWSIDQVTALFKAAKILPGRTASGIPAALLMTAVCGLAYETGVRPSDWRGLQWQDVDLDRRLVSFVQHKTGKPHTAAFSHVTAAALLELRRYGCASVVPVSMPAIRRWESVLFRTAENLFGFSKRKGQALGTLRKSHATAVYLSHGELAAALSLGHVSGTAVARRHYIDSSVSSDPVRIEIPNGQATQPDPGSGSDRPGKDSRENRAAHDRPGRFAG
jgi:integrase